MKKLWFSLLALALALVSMLSMPALVMAKSPPTPTGMWSSTGSMNVARLSHTATLLLSGKVLVAGGYGASLSQMNSCELYNPKTGSWSATGSMNTARVSHTATLLLSGKVLVIGGCGYYGGYSLSSCELYDPKTGIWCATGSLKTARVYQTATLLPSGKVLVAGGYNFSGGAVNTLSSCELYDPKTGSWSATGGMSTARYGDIAAFLPNGKVLVAGGCGSGGAVNTLSSCELYDPKTGSWSATGSMSTARQDHTATLLLSGKVLVAGGIYCGGASQIIELSSCELYDPKTGNWSTTGSMSIARDAPTATLLPNGQVLVAGGYDGGYSLSSCELYGPKTGSWSATGSMSAARVENTITLLPSSKVLVAGGGNDIPGYVTSALNSCELYTPSNK